MILTRRAAAVGCAFALLLGVPAPIPAWGADPSPGIASFSLTGSLVEAHGGHTATLLPDGRVLVVGGGDMVQALASAELWVQESEAAQHLSVLNPHTTSAAGGPR